MEVTIKKYCPICNPTKMEYAFSKTVLDKYQVEYYKCSTCGLLQTQEPYWLDEAYSDAIAVADTGLVTRNISLAAKVSSLLYFIFDKNGAYLDLAGGYGMFARLMRDIGFDFYWSDKFCSNMLARGFESETAESDFSALTAFEVLEHVHDPIDFLQNAFVNHNCKTLIFTTELYQEPFPEKDWWYFALNTGQHVSFYQHRTLKKIANKLGVYAYSENGLHILTDRKINPKVFKILSGRIGFLAAIYVKKRLISKTESDYEKLTGSSI